MVMRATVRLVVLTGLLLPMVPTSGFAGEPVGPVRASSGASSDTVVSKTEKPKADRVITLPPVIIKGKAAKSRVTPPVPLEERRPVPDQLWDTEFFVQNDGHPVSPHPWDAPMQVASTR
jgi:hypothetical protein